MESEQTISTGLRTKCIYLCFCLLIISLIVVIFYDEIYETVVESSSPIVYTFSALATFCFSYIALNCSKNLKEFNGRSEKDGGFLEEKELFEYSKKDIEEELNLLKTENKEIELLLNKYDGFERIGKKLEDMTFTEIKTEIDDLLLNARSVFVPYGIRKIYTSKINNILSKSTTLRNKIRSSSSWTPNKLVINYNFLKEIKSGIDKTKEKLFIEEYILTGKFPSHVASVINDLDKNNFINTSLERPLLNLLYSFLPFSRSAEKSPICPGSYINDKILNETSSKNYQNLMSDHNRIIQYLEDVITKDPKDFSGNGVPLYYLDNCLKSVKGSFDNIPPALRPRELAELSSLSSIPESQLTKTQIIKLKELTEKKRERERYERKDDKKQKISLDLSDIQGTGNKSKKPKPKQTITQSNTQSENTAALAKSRPAPTTNKIKTPRQNESKPEYKTVVTVTKENTSEGIAEAKETNKPIINYGYEDDDADAKESRRPIVNYESTNIAEAKESRRPIVNYEYKNDADAKGRENDADAKDGDVDEDNLFSKMETAGDSSNPNYPVDNSSDLDKKLEQVRAERKEIEADLQRIQKQSLDIDKLINENPNNTPSTNSELVNKESINALSRNLDLRTPKVNFLNVPLDSSNAFSAALYSRDYASFLVGKDKNLKYPDGMFNVAMKLNDTYLRLAIHYYTNKLRIKELEDMDNSCIDKISKAGTRVREMQTEILELREAAKELEKIKILEGEIEDLREGKLELSAKVLSLENDKSKLDKKLTEMKNDNTKTLRISTLEAELESERRELEREIKKTTALTKEKQEIVLQLGEMEQSNISLDEKVSEIPKLKRNIEELEDELAIRKDEIQKKEGKIDELTNEYEKELAVMRKASKEKSETISELQEELKDKNSQMTKMKDQMDDMEYEIKIYNRQKNDMQFMERFSNTLVSKLVSMNRQIDSASNSMDVAMAKYTAYITKKDKKLKEIIKSTNYSIDLISNGFARIDRITSRVENAIEQFSKYRDNRKEATNVYNSQINKTKKYVEDLREKLRPFFITNGAGFHYLKEHVNQKYQEKVKLLKALNKVEFEDKIRYTKQDNLEFFEKEMNKKNNKAYTEERINLYRKLFDVDKELHYQIKIVQRFNNLVNTIFTEYKPIDLNSLMTEKAAMEVLYTNTGILAEYSFLINKYSEYIHDYNKTVQLNETLVAKNKVLEEKLNFVQRQNDILQSATSPDKSNSVSIEMLKKEIGRLNTEVEEFFRNNSGSMQDMKEHEISMNKLTKSINAKNLQIAKLNEAIEFVEKERLLTVQNTIDSSYQEFHKELDEIVEVLGLQKSMQTPVEYGNVDMGNIKKKQMAIISRVRDLIISEDYKKQAEEEMRKLKNEAKEMKDTIKSKDIIIEELKSAIKSGTNLLDDTIINNPSKDLVKTHTELLNEEKQKLQKQLEEIEIDRAEIIEDFNKLKKKYSDEQEKEKREDKNLVSFANKIAKVSTFLVTPTQYYSDEIARELFRCISSRGIKRMFIHFIIDYLFNEKGKRVLFKEVGKQKENELSLDSIFLERDILTEEGLNTFMGYIGLDDEDKKSRVTFFSYNLDKYMIRYIEDNGNSISYKTGNAEENDDDWASEKEDEAVDNVDDEDIIPSSENIEVIRNDIVEEVETEEPDETTQVEDDIDVLIIVLLYELGFINKSSELFKRYYSNAIFEKHNNGSSFDDAEFLKDCITASIQYKDNFYSLIRNSSTSKSKLATQIIKDFSKDVVYNGFNYVKNHNVIISFTEYFFPECKFMSTKSLTNLLLENDNEFGVDMDWLDSIIVMVINDAVTFRNTKLQIKKIKKGLDSYYKEIENIELIISDKIPQKLAETQNYIMTKLSILKYIAFNINQRDFTEQKKILRELSQQKEDLDPKELLLRETEAKKLIEDMSKEFQIAVEEYKKRPAYKLREKNGNPMSRAELEAATIVRKVLSMINNLKEESKDIIRERDDLFSVFYYKIGEVSTKLGDYTFYIQEEMSKIDDLIKLGKVKNDEIKTLKAKVLELESKRNENEKLEKILNGHTETSIKVKEHLDRLSSRISNLNKQREELSRQSSYMSVEKESRENKIDEYKMYIDGIEAQINRINSTTKKNNAVNKEFYITVKELSEKIQRYVDRDMKTDIHDKLTELIARVLSSLDEKRELAIEVSELRKSKENIINSVNEVLNGLSSNNISNELLVNAGAREEEINTFINHWKTIIDIVNSSESQKVIYDMLDDIYEKLSGQSGDTNLSLDNTKLALQSLDNKIKKMVSISEMIDKLQSLAKRQEELVVKDTLIQELEKNLLKKEQTQKKLEDEVTAYNNLQIEFAKVNNEFKVIEEKILRSSSDIYNLESRLRNIESFIINIKEKLVMSSKEINNLVTVVGYQNSSVDKVKSELEQNNSSILGLINSITEYQKKSTRLIYPEELDRQISKYVDMSIDYFNRNDLDIKYISQLMTTIEDRWKSGVSTISDYASKNKKLELEVERLTKELAVASSKNCDAEVKELEEAKSKLKAIELIMDIFSSPTESDIAVISKLKDNSSFSINSSNLIDYLISKREKSKELINIFNKSFSEWEDLKVVLSKLGLLEKIQTVISMYENYRKLTDQLIEQNQKSEEDLASTKKLLDDSLLTKRQLEENILALEKDKSDIEKYISQSASSTINDIVNNIVSKDREVQYLLQVVELINSASKKHIGETDDIQIQVTDIIKNSNKVRNKITDSTYTVGQIYPIIISSIDEIKNNILEKARKQFEEDKKITIENIHNEYAEKIKSIEDKIEEYNLRLSQYEFINKDLEMIRSYMEGEIKRQKELTEGKIKQLEEELKTAMTEKQELSSKIEQLLAINNLTDNTIASVRALLQSNNTDITNIVFRLGNIIEYTANLRKQYDLSLDKLTESNKLSTEEKEQAVEDYNQIFNLMEDTMSAMSDILGDVNDEEDNFKKSREIILSMTQLKTQLVDYKKLVDNSIMSVDKLQEAAVNSIDYIYESSKIINQLTVFIDSMNSGPVKKIINIVDREKEIIQKLNNNEMTELNAFINKKVSNALIKEKFKNKMLSLQVNKLKQDISNILKNINTNQAIVRQPKEIIKYVTVVEEVYIPVAQDNTVVKPIVKKNKPTKVENQYAEYEKYIKTLKKNST